MKKIQSIEVNDSSKEELLPGFSHDFPYISTCAELDKYLESVVPWHWHRTVELFYMKSGSLDYTTPKGKWTFPTGSGGFVNSNVLHSTSFQVSADSNIQLLHLFDPTFLSGEHGSRMEAKYILPLTTASGVEVIPLYPDVPEQAVILEKIKQALPIIGALMLMLSVFAKGEQKTRLFLLLNGAAWVVYTAAMGATTFFGSSASMVSSGIALWKYRNLEKR